MQSEFFSIIMDRNGQLIKYLEQESTKTSTLIRLILSKSVGSVTSLEGTNFGLSAGLIENGIMEQLILHSLSESDSSGIVWLFLSLGDIPSFCIQFVFYLF